MGGLTKLDPGFTLLGKVFGGGSGGGGLVKKSLGKPGSVTRKANTPLTRARYSETQGSGASTMLSDKLG